jgi:gentisate 1,2-dioxygenase
MRGSVADRRPAAQPLFHYPHDLWRKNLADLARNADIDPHLGHALEFINPADGGPVMPTISAHARLIPAGFETRSRRATDGTVFVVVTGEGHAEVGEAQIPLRPRDVLVVPSWKPLRFAARRDLVLFGFSDRASQQKLNLYKETCE